MELDVARTEEEEDDLDDSQGSRDDQEWFVTPAKLLRSFKVEDGHPPLPGMDAATGLYSRSR